MNPLTQISPERASDFASFRTLRNLQLSYDPGEDGFDALNVTLTLSGQGNGPASRLLFVGVQQIDIKLGASQPFTEEVLVTSVRTDHLENLNYQVSSDVGPLEFHFYCNEILGAEAEK